MRPRRWWSAEALAARLRLPHVVVLFDAGNDNGRATDGGDHRGLRLVRGRG